MAIAAVLGALAAALVVAAERGVGAITINRAPRPQWARYFLHAALLVASALVEELLFRVFLISALDQVAPEAIAVCAAAAIFAGPHAMRGRSALERAGAVVTSFWFGLVLGIVWLLTGELGLLVAFHVAFNICAGLVLGAAAADPLSRRLGVTPVWPLHQTRAQLTVRQFLASTAAEVAAVGVTGLVLVTA